MAITHNSKFISEPAIKEVTSSGITTGNEVIVQVNPDKPVTIEAYVTSAGTAGIYYTSSATKPTNTSSMVQADVDFTTNTSFSAEENITYVCVKVTSGTWTQIVRQS